MKFFALCSDKEYELDVGSDPSYVLLNGNVHKASLTHLRGDLFTLSLDDKVITLSIREMDGKLSISDGVRSTVVSIEDHLHHSLSSLISKNEAQSRIGPVVAPMPGLVVKLLVQQGQKVSEDQGLLIIEAMKMENEIRSPFEGIVKEIKIEEKQSVEKGAILLLVE